MIVSTLSHSNRMAFECSIRLITDNPLGVVLWPAFTQRLHLPAGKPIVNPCDFDGLWPVISLVEDSKRRLKWEMRATT